MREAMIRETKEDYGAIFGVSLGEEYLEQIEKLRIDRAL